MDSVENVKYYKIALHVVVQWMDVIVENDQTFDQTHIAYSVGRSFSVIGLW
jgi:hypothetical protein